MVKRRNKGTLHEMRGKGIPENQVFVGNSKGEMLDFYDKNLRWHNRNVEDRTALALRWVADVIGASKWGVVEGGDEIEELKNIFLDAAMSLEELDRVSDAKDRKSIAKKLTDSLGITSANKRPKLTGQAALDLLYKYTIDEGQGKMEAYEKIAKEYGYSKNSTRSVTGIIERYWEESWTNYYDHLESINHGEAVNRVIHRDPVEYWKSNINQSVEIDIPDIEDYFQDMEK
ncbi:TPA: hypothetical protein ACPVX7_004261 [Vibrio parahaemolyticus]|uniref:hypothetical protein n=1 Tax=Vibrio parahaemolyticus TaxID=670 RepID=UPI0004710029|nr:hypothetical protein [Vibrio parahaemolyticus]